MIDITPGTIPVPRLHHYLLGAVGPRPIALASTINSEGIPNLAPFSFFNVFSANPPILIFSPARSGRTNSLKDTYHNVKAIPEVVINVVTYSIAEAVSLASSPYPHGVSEFEKSGLSPLASDVVRPFRVKESPVQFECKVNQVMELGSEGGAGNLIICEVLKMHIDESIMDSEGMIDALKIDLVSRMGGDWYCRSTPESMFEIKKPITTCGIGFDALPVDIRKSRILSGQDLARLAGIEGLPDETAVNEYKLLELSDIFLQLSGKAIELEETLHVRAKSLLSEHRIQEAWLTLLSFNN
ncbi:MAG: flavin reductase family protein [Flavobacteriia bacterium]|nr:flavin reductase family protein [Flavobacteriia bacterium]